MKQTKIKNYKILENKEVQIILLQNLIDAIQGEKKIKVSINEYIELDNIVSTEIDSSTNNPYLGQIISTYETTITIEY